MRIRSIPFSFFSARRHFRVAALLWVIIHLYAGPAWNQQKENTKAAHEVRVLSAVGMREVVRELGPQFERATGKKLRVSFDSGAVIEKRVASGEKTDVVLISRASVDRLATAGKLRSGSIRDLATSIVAVAVRKGAPKPDISTAEAFKKAMLAASSIACPDPALGGSSGSHIAKVFERLGIAEVIKPKLVLVSTPDRMDMMPGYAVANGRAEIALHQLQELLAVPGVDIVGPFPKELEGKFLFTGAVPIQAANQKASRSFIEFLRTRKAKALIKAKGMEPTRD